MKLLRRVLLAAVVLAAVLYLGAVGYMYANQRSLQYFPAGELIALDTTGLTETEQVAIGSGDDIVNGWYHAPRAGMPIIVYYKGNSQSFTEEYERFVAFAAAGYGFIAFDYRGFPASPGEISQDNILHDSLAVFDWAAQQGAPLVIWGRSIGTGPATYVASERDARALLLETPFLSAVNVAAERYPYLPVYWVMQDQYRSDEWIADVSEPVFVAHGTGDTVIEASNGERLYQLAPNKDELWIVPDAGHSDLWDAGIWNQAQAFFERAMAR